MFGENRVHFDAEDLMRKSGEDGSLVSRTRPDFKDPVFRFQIEPFCHVGDERGLRNRGPAFDRECAIAPGMPYVDRANEAGTVDAQECPTNARIRDLRE